MARSAASCSVSCASYFAACRKVLHKIRLDRLGTAQSSGRRRLKQLPASFHYAAASHSIPLSSIRFTHMMRKMKKDSFSICNAILPALYYCGKRNNSSWKKTSNKIVDLSVASAVEILNPVKYLKSQHKTIICNQICRAVTLL